MFFIQILDISHTHVHLHHVYNTCSSALIFSTDHKSISNVKLDFIEIELDTSNDIDLPPDFTKTQTNNDSLDTQIDQNFDLQPEEIDFPPNESDSDNESSNSDPNPNLDDYEMEIEPDTDNDQLPPYKITNFPMTNLEHDEPASLLIDERDKTIGWNYEKLIVDLLWPYP